MTKTDFPNHAEEYLQREADFAELVREVKFGLTQRLDRSGVRIAALEGRVKPLDSFLEKIHRKGCESPWDEIDDIAGIRLVCLFSAELESIESIIASLFEVISTEDKVESLGVERMGYQGRHYVVRLGSSQSGPRYDKLQDLRAEIQVRTTLQDAWARISHNLVYKSEASIPAPIRRELQNVSSLLEIAQNIFDRSESSRNQYIADIEESAESEDQLLTRPIDRETLEAYTKRKFSELPVDLRIQELLLRDLNHDKFEKIGDIDNVIRKAEKAVGAYKQDNPDWFKAGTDFITKSLGFVDQEFRSRHPFGKRTLDAFARYETKIDGS